MFKLSSKSLNKMRGQGTGIPLHPDLANIVRKAITTSTIDFGVGEVGRTIDRQIQLHTQGKSTTLKSKHLRQDDGYSHAVDLYVYVNGKVSWEHKDFRPVVQAMFDAAIEQGTPLRAGCLWRSFQDSPHFELRS
ncbi:MAG: M15 family peptidase [Sulfurimonas sp.]|nr:M15 family peptidase [Sulfurimonas sp.]